MKSFLTNGPGFRAVCAIALTLFATATACAPDVPQDEDVERTQTVFDSEAGAIPLPSDLALEEDGTLPNLGEGLPVSAQADFYAYLDTLHGWLPSTPLTVPVAGPVDESTLTPEAALLFRFTETGAETLDIADVSLNEEANQIVITPAEPLELGTRYGYVLTDTVQDPAGAGLIAAQPIFFQLSTEPLVDEEGNITNSLLAQAATPAEAAQLEGARQFMQPVIEAAMAEGVDRRDIVALSNFHTALDTFAVFDPTAGVVPFPNEFIRTGDGGTVALPVPEDAGQLTAAVIGELNSRDGFSITADGYIPLAGGPLDATTIVADESIRLAYVADPLPVPYTADQYYLEYREDFGAIVFGPEGEPFRQGRTHAGVVTTDVTDQNGFALKPSSAFVFLRTTEPLFEDGKSTVEQLSDDQAQTLEAARQSYAELFVGAATLNIRRRNIAIAWAFVTDVATEYQQQLNAVAEASAIADAGGSPSALADPTTAEADPADFNNVGLIQRAASYTTAWFLNPDNPLQLLEEPVTQGPPATVPVIVTIPSDADCTKPADGYPIVIITHGDGGSREDAVATFADALAAECLASVAPDFPLHGARTPPDPETGDPGVSGELFLTANAIATKNNFLQAVVDLSVLTEVIKEDGLEGTLDADAATNFIDEAQIGYAGFSLGALVGTNFLATEGDVNIGALNTPGAKITAILQESPTFSQAILDPLLAALGLTSGTFEYFQTFSLLQWVIEPADPWTFAPHVISDPLVALSYDAGADEFVASDETLPSNDVIIQMAEGDAVIPNSATELLAEAIGVSLDDTTFAGVDHSFIRDDTAGECARSQIATFLASGLDGADDGTVVDTCP
jgi:dienelactone hydrolase